MPVVVAVQPGGAFKVATKSAADARLLSSIPYLRAAGGLWSGRWTYLPDLARDLVGVRQFYTPGSAAALRGLVDRLPALERGSDDEVRALFRKEAQPYPFQVAGIHFGVNVRRSLLADDVGLGKTIQALGVMAVAFRRKLAARAMIVCPMAVKAQWASELDAFLRPGAVPGRVRVVQGSPSARRQTYAGRWTVLILNPELLVRDARYLARIAPSIGIAILDESSVIKNEGTQVAGAVKAILGRAPFRLALTATPVENKLDDLWSIFQFVDPAAFPSRAYFSSRYIVWRSMRFRVKTKTGRTVLLTQRVPASYRRLDEVKQKIRGLYLRRRVEDVGVEMPRVVVRWEQLDLPPRQREVYDALKADAIKEVEGLRGEALLAPLAFLRQACDSTALVSEGTGRPAQVKVDRLRRLLETELAGERVLVFTEYERFARIVARELRAFKVGLYTGPMGYRERTAAVNALAAGDVRVLVLTAAGERGLNLQMAGVVVNLDVPFNPARLKQRIGRARRLKSEFPVVRVLNLVARDTVETKLVMPKLYSKRALAEGVFGADELTTADPVARLTGREVARLL